MSRLRDLHTSIFDFATKVMTAIDSQRGAADRSSQVTATIVFAGDGISRDIIISHTTALNAPIRLDAVFGSIKASGENDSEEMRVQEQWKCHGIRAGPYTEKNASLASIP